MKPSWLTVEYASTFLKSFCAKPMIAANSAVSRAHERHDRHRRGASA
jgi:hypothetical protein